MIRYCVYSLTPEGVRTHEECFTVYGTNDYAGTWCETVMGWARLQGFKLWEVWEDRGRTRQ